MNINEITEAHRWIKNKSGGNANKCENCGITEGYFEWSNKDHTYKKDVNNWQMLCKPCHALYDVEKGLRTYQKYENQFIVSMLVSCKRCNYIWQSRIENPKCCPRCKRYLK